MGSGPRDPDKFDGTVDAQREFRMRSIPSGLAHEIYPDVYERVKSFEPGVPFPQRMYDAYPRWVVTERLTRREWELAAMCTALETLIELQATAWLP